MTNVSAPSNKLRTWITSEGPGDFFLKTPTKCHQTQTRAPSTFCTFILLSLITLKQYFLAFFWRLLAHWRFQRSVLIRST